MGYLLWKEKIGQKVKNVFCTESKPEGKGGNRRKHLRKDGKQNNFNKVCSKMTIDI